LGHDGQGGNAQGEGGGAQGGGQCGVHELSL
jgi:hypothetical protein